jgi:hypothetical protein
MQRQGSMVLSALGRIAGGFARLAFGAAAHLGWRTGAACSGLLAAGWLASVVPSVLDNSAEASAPSMPAVTGSLPAATQSALRPEWIIVARASPTFALGLADIEGQPIRPLMRRERHSDAREDQLTAGQFAEPATFAHLALRRRHSSPETSFFVEASRHAAQDGLAIERSTQALPLASKFGLVEAADVVLSDGATSRACLAFRHSAEDVAFAFHGWLCGSDKRAADRQQLTCLLERINLVSAGDDRPLRAYFGKAELNRQPSCLSPKLQAAGRKTTWLDADQSAPTLRRVAR